MKKKIVISLLCLTIISMVGCGKKEEVPEGTYVDGGVVVGADIIDETDPTTQMSYITEDMITDNLSDREADILKQSPRNQDGTFNTAQMSKEQLEIYNMLSTEKFIDFTSNDAKEAIKSFFNSNYTSLGYSETLSIIFKGDFRKTLTDEEKETLCNITYAGTVRDRRSDARVEGLITFYTEDRCYFNLNANINRIDNYFYGFQGVDLETDAVMMYDSDYMQYEILNDMGYMLENAVDLKVVDETAYGYVATCTIPEDIVKESTVLTKPYVSDLFYPDENDVTATVYFNLATHKITKVTFVQEWLEFENQETGKPDYAAEYTVSYDLNTFNEDYSYETSSKEDAELFYDFFLYLLDNPKEAEIIAKGGTYTDVLEYRRTGKSKVLDSPSSDPNAVPSFNPDGTLKNGSNSNYSDLDNLPVSEYNPEVPTETPQTDAEGNKVFNTDANN